MIPHNNDTYQAWLADHPTALEQYVYAKKNLLRYKDFDSFYQRPPLYEVFHSFLKVNKISVYKVMHPIRDNVCKLLETNRIADIHALHNDCLANKTPLTDYQRYLYNTVVAQKPQKDSIYILQLTSAINGFDVTYYDFAQQIISANVVQGLEYWWAFKDLRELLTKQVCDDSIQENIRSKLVLAMIRAFQKNGWWDEEVQFLETFLRAMSVAQWWPEKGSAFTPSDVEMLKKCLPEDAYTQWSQYVSYALIHDVTKAESWIQDMLSIDPCLSSYELSNLQKVNMSTTETPLY